MAATPRWLRTLPPVRWTPQTIKRRRHHTSLHHALHDPVETAVVDLGRGGGDMITLTVNVAMRCLALALWIAEFEAWLLAWVYFGTFLAGRWIYRRNVIGQTVATFTRRRPVPVPIDPYARPVDLAAYSYDDEAPVRRRS